jgi:hypothetical protein
MAQRNKLKGVTNIEDIRVNVPRCPGCGYEHDIAVKRPVTTHNCSRQTGTFTVTVTAGDGQLTVNISFNGKEITKDCRIST